MKKPFDLMALGLFRSVWLPREDSLDHEVFKDCRLRRTANYPASAGLGISKRRELLTKMGTIKVPIFVILPREDSNLGPSGYT
jgi:hypothetical protein